METLELNTLAAFNQEGKVIKTWDYKMVENNGSFAKLYTMCFEKGCNLRVCFNNDPEVEKYGEELLKKQLKNFKEG
jgi:hypothetical protein